jgi:hypothetical protein
MKKQKIIFINLVLLMIVNSCCLGAKETFLGNNIYLSEYDNVDRRILYQKENCAISSAEIVPMTVTEIAYNSEWIIAKSKIKAEFKYWIIKNNYDHMPNSETVIKNTTEFNDDASFKSFVTEKKINLELKKIN